MKFLTLAFILTLSFSTLSFAEGMDASDGSGAICDQRSSDITKADEIKKERELEESTVIIN